MDSMLLSVSTALLGQSQKNFKRLTGAILGFHIKLQRFTISHVKAKKSFIFILKPSEVEGVVHETQHLHRVW